MDYKKYPGKTRADNGKLINKEDAQISIITPYYNSDKSIRETFNSIMNQTYPYFEWIVVDDGSKEESLKVLKELEKEDKRLKVYSIENVGPATARDIGISKASNSSKYIFFIDSDDLIDKTTLEILYWTLETHKDTSFAYTTTVNFGSKEYLWEKYFTVEEEKEDNLLTIAALVKKDALLEVGCFNLKEKSVYEDWNLWLKLISKKHKPIRVSAPLFWYRHENESELSRANSNSSAMKYIIETRESIPDDILEAIQFPRIDNHKEDKYNMILPKYDIEKELYIIPTLTKEYGELIKNNSIVISLFPTTSNEREYFPEDTYDLSTFIDRVDYLDFIKYIIESRKIKEINITDINKDLYNELKELYSNITINYQETNTINFEEEVNKYYIERFDIYLNRPKPKDVKKYRKAKEFAERIHAKKEWLVITNYRYDIKEAKSIIKIIPITIIYLLSVISFTIKSIIRIITKPFR